MKRILAENSGSEASEQRRRGIFAAALGIFARFGFRKTSMDEVARAAEISRQGLYLYFATKEELFRALVEHVLESGFSAAQAELKNSALPLDRKLAGAFDAWIGRHVGMMGAEAADLIGAANSLMGDQIRKFETRFADAVARAIRSTPLAETYAASGISPKQLVTHLQAVARGLKYHCTDRAQFGREFSVSLKILFTPVKPD